MKKDRVQGRSVVFRFRYEHKGFVKVGRRREPPEGSGSKVTSPAILFFPFTQFSCCNNKE